MATSPLLQPAERPEGISDPYWVYLDHLGTPESQRTLRLALDGIVAMVMEADASLPEHRVTGEDRPWWLLRQADTQRLVEMLTSPERGFAPAQINKKMSVLRGVLETCWELGLMSSDDYLRASRELKNVSLGSRT